MQDNKFLQEPLKILQDLILEPEKVALCKLGHTYCAFHVWCTFIRNECHMNSTAEAVGSILLKKKDTRPQQSDQEECTEKYVGLDKWNGIGLGL